MANSDEQGQWWFCTRHMTVEPADTPCPGKDLLGPYTTREEALVAVKRHLKTFNVSGHNPEGDYWWARDAEGLRKCWISSAG